MRFVPVLLFASMVLALPYGSPKPDTGRVGFRDDADDLINNVWSESNPSNAPRDTTTDADDLINNVWSESNPSNAPHRRDDADDLINNVWSESNPENSSN